ncbi:MAG TPA: nucleoside triphosphate pyrophosphohydrolase [Candidatus Binatia bacterium]|jgi:MazG family protein|nr:nucleoside triphosphate pyrophosphohydrolase [Candidatus Binatia bacterium]
MASADARDTFDRLVDIMARLRAPGGCPWDREQTAESLQPYLVEEAYEVLDAIADGDPESLRDELGDVLLQVVFHAEIAAETGRFGIADVARAIGDKLVRRHPHVFGDVTVRDADEVSRNWREIKAAERRAKGIVGGVLSSVPRALPALPRAQQVGDKLADVGFDWPDLAGTLAKVDEERQELEEAVASGDAAAAARELGDLLLTMTSVARHLGVSAEIVLREATERLSHRVAEVESQAAAAGTSLGALDATARDRLWEEAKRRTAAKV